MAEDFSKLVGNIPEDMQNQEAIQSAKDMLVGNPKNDPHTAVATAAIWFGAHGIIQAMKEIQKMNQELEGQWPNGDLVALAGLYAAAGALSQIFLETMPKAAIEWACDIGDQVLDDVKAMIKQTTDKDFGIGVTQPGPNCFSLKIKREPKP